MSSGFLDLSTVRTAHFSTTGSYLGHNFNVNAPVAVYASSSSPGQSSLLTGSWFGNENTWGASVQLALSITSSYSGSLAEGTWWGIDNSWGTHQLLSESRDRTNPVSNLHPETDEGMGPGDWDPFPTPAGTTEAPNSERDTTRFRKTYSSQRTQPKRIRLVRG